MLGRVKPVLGCGHRALVVGFTCTLVLFWRVGFVTFMWFQIIGGCDGTTWLGSQVAERVVGGVFGCIVFMFLDVKQRVILVSLLGFCRVYLQTVFLVWFLTQALADMFCFRFIRCLLFLVVLCIVARCLFTLLVVGSGSF